MYDACEIRVLIIPDIFLLFFGRYFSSHEKISRKSTVQYQFKVKKAHVRCFPSFAHSFLRKEIAQSMSVYAHYRYFIDRVDSVMLFSVLWLLPYIRRFCGCDINDENSIFMIKNVLIIIEANATKANSLS